MSNQLLPFLVQPPFYMPQGVSTLAASLPSSIVDLDISNNPAVGAKGGVAIGRFLIDFVRSANLRRLDVSGCNLGDEGLVGLAEGVEAARGLDWLGVARNLNSPGSVGAGGGTGAGKVALGEFFCEVAYGFLPSLDYAVDETTFSKEGNANEKCLGGEMYR